MELETNFRYLKRSTKKSKTGDIFAMLPPDGKYLFGRVVSVDLPRENAPMPGADLIYIYQERSADKEPPVDKLIPDNLLVAPIFTNRKGWTKGVFETVGHSDLSAGDRLAQHCFWDAPRKRFVDEEQNLLTQEVEPCGSWSLASFQRIDDLVSDALGLERAPRN